MADTLQNFNLQQLLEKNAAIPAEEVVEAGLRIASLLAHYHKEGRSFGLLFPDQIVFDSSGHVEILTLSAPRDPEELTPTYLSFVPPERLQQPNLPPRPENDVYSLGVALF